MLSPSRRSILTIKIVARAAGGAAGQKPPNDTDVKKVVAEIKSGKVPLSVVQAAISAGHIKSTPGYTPTGDAARDDESAKRVADWLKGGGHIHPDAKAALIASHHYLDVSKGQTKDNPTKGAKPKGGAPAGKAGKAPAGKAAAFGGAKGKVARDFDDLDAREFDDIYARGSDDLDDLSTREVEALYAREFDELYEREVSEILAREDKVEFEHIESLLEAMKGDKNVRKEVLEKLNNKSNLQHSVQKLLRKYVEDHIEKRESFFGYEDLFGRGEPAKVRYSDMLHLVQASKNNPKAKKALLKAFNKDKEVAAVTKELAQKHGKESEEKEKREAFEEDFDTIFARDAEADPEAYYESEFDLYEY